MARRKASSNEFREDPDEALVEAEVVGTTDDPAPTTEAPTVEPTLHLSDSPQVTIKGSPKPKEPTLSASTIAEQGAGRATLEANKPKSVDGDDGEPT